MNKFYNFINFSLLIIVVIFLLKDSHGVHAVSPISGVWESLMLFFIFSSKIIKIPILRNFCYSSNFSLKHSENNSNANSKSISETLARVSMFSG